MNIEKILEHAQEFGLKELFIQASIADSLERIAHQLESGQLSILEGENIVSKLTIIGDRIPD